MKILIFITSLLSFYSLFGQEKGAAPVSNGHTESGITRALVVGVSDYQDSDIPDLRFAHQDAIEFKTYLKSKSGGSLPENQIKLLINEQATVAQIYSALDWLLDDCGQNDKVIIYFSGHGDVETKTLHQRGFLLAYDTPPTNYRIGAVRLEDLNDILETIVQVNKSKIIVITDACRSGNLAGGREGVLSTASALAATFQNEIKIMSCQPNELSLEGEQWGGGRGAFSFHLIDGLTGMADKNNDHQVSLFEIDRYLQDMVSAETDQRQFPNTTGNKGAILSKVDATELELLKALRTNSSQLSSIASKGLVEQVLVKADTSVQELYQEFLAALDDKYFLASDKNPTRQSGRSASELYDLLSIEASIEPLHHFMKRNFAAALQDESQQALNAYLRSEPAELAARWNVNIEKYKSNPVYIQKAASLLGESHILYRQLLAKQYYFEGLIKRLEGIKTKSPVMFEEALALVEKALEFDEDAAYLYNEIALIYDQIRYHKTGRTKEENAILQEKQIEYYKMAMNLAPKWIMPKNNLGWTFKELRKLEEAEKIGKEIISLDSNFVNAYELLVWVFYYAKKYEDCIDANRKLIEIDPQSNQIWRYYNIACMESLLGRTNMAISTLEKAIQFGIGYREIQEDADLSSIRDKEAFIELMQKYFPDEKE